MSILAIDPGTEKSGWVKIVNGKPTRWGWDKNEAVRLAFPDWAGGLELVLIEDIVNYGMSVGQDIFKTVRWSGRFQEAALMKCRLKTEFITRPAVKLALCQDMRAKDSNVRQALIDYYGGNRVAIGGIKCSTCKGKGWVGRGRVDCEDCHHWTPLKENETDYLRGCGYEVHPGPLHGISGHVWSALGVGVTYLEQQKLETPI